MIETLRPKGANVIKIQAVAHFFLAILLVAFLALGPQSAFAGAVTMSPEDTQSAPPVTESAGPVATKASALPHDLSLWSIIQSADGVVKLVMLVLTGASAITWTTLLSKSIELTRAVRRQRVAIRTVASLSSLAEADAVGAGAVAMVKAARTEVALSADALGDRDGVKERIASHLERIEASLGRSMTRGMGLLATIGATAPFVGLFGTVWGIMNSFIGISKTQTTNLAVVAPGIAEALLTTAVGLVAAIPAVVVYNHFTRQVSAYKALVADTAAAVLRLVSRDLSRGVSRKTSDSNLHVAAE